MGEGDGGGGGGVQWPRIFLMRATQAMHLTT